MRAKEQIAGFAEQLGTDPPAADEFKVVLALAAEAAPRLRANRRAGRVLAERKGTPLAEGVDRPRAARDSGA